MQVRKAAEKLAVRLNRPDPAGHDIVVRQQSSGLRLKARPITRRKCPQQPTIKAGCELADAWRRDAISDLPSTQFACALLTD